MKNRVLTFDSKVLKAKIKALPKKCNAVLFLYNAKNKFNTTPYMIRKLLYSFLFFIFLQTVVFGQTTRTYTTNTSFVVPAGSTPITVDCWGGGGAGGGSTNISGTSAKGGAGGGGGAYARSVLTVTGGNQINAVVGVGGIGNSGADGNDGGFSNITSSIPSLNNAVRAAGGSGGKGNISGGSPLGGAGGTVANSVGTFTRTAGNNGGDGDTGFGIESGAGGSGAGTGGGAGGGVRDFWDGTNNGVAGSIFGGGGGGARTSQTGGSRAGGDGAAGKVAVTYTCQTYSITSVAGIICGSSGASSITLTGTAAGLPVGIYTVTYNTTTPTLTGRTATMTVTTPGSGSFLTTDISTVGSTIRITNLGSGSESANPSVSLCSNSVNSSATLVASSIGAVSANQTICYNTQPNNITLTGNTGTIQWQVSSDNSAFSDVLGATSSPLTSAQIGALTATRYYRAVVTTGLCPAVNSGVVTVTVRSQFSTGTIASTGETICYGGTPATTIGSTTDASGGDAPITYSWRSSADGYAAAISGATSSTYLPPAGLTATTSYRRYAKDNTCSTTPAVATGTWQVTVRSQFSTGTIASTGETICYGGTPATTIGSTTDASGGVTPITYSWRSSADGYAAAISGATSSTYLPPAGLTATT
ncbi:hypothetical protein EV145_11490, partial [Flavobacterium sp. 245]